MKISLFAHMERTDELASHQKLYSNFVELCQVADQNGFSTIWIGEHHGMDFTIAPNPFAQICDLANKTRNVRLGTATVIAPFWHPIKLVGESSMVDIITHGRLDICLSRGAYEFEYERLHPGLDAWTAGEKLREMIPTLQAMWAGDYAHNGKHWQFPATTSIPKPVQTPHPPLWIAARDPDTHNFAVAHGCSLQVTPLWQGDHEVENLIAKFNTALAHNPDVPRPRIMVLRHIYVGETEADLTLASEQLSKWYCTFGGWFKNNREVNNGSMAPVSAKERAQIEMFSPENMRRNLIIGTPDEVIERLKFYESLGYDEFSIWLDNGMDHAHKKKTLQLFIDQVMPAFAT